MDCNEVETKLQLFIDDELSASEVQELRRHMEACNPCEKRLELEKRFKDALREMTKRHVEEQEVDSLRSFVLHNAY